MANYAFFRPTSFSQTKNFDDFINPQYAYDVGNDTYCKTDTDRSYTNSAHATGLTFVPYSQCAPYVRHAKDEYSKYTISESLPQGAVIIGVMCGMNFSSRVTSLGNAPLLELGVTRDRNNDTSFYQAYASYEPNTGNMDIRPLRTGCTYITDLDTILNSTQDWLKNNVYLLYQVTGRHTGWLSSTVIWLYELYAFCRWKLPFRMTIVNGYGYQDASSGQVSSIKNVYEYDDIVGYNAYPNSGYSAENPIITFSQGNPSYTWKSSNKSFVINALREGVNVKIEFRKERSIYVDCNEGGSVALSTSNKVPDGAQVTLTATPNPGYRFVQWNDGDANANRTVTVTSDITYTATFALINYNVNFNGNGLTFGSMDPLSFTYNSSYTLTNNKFKKIGYTFKNWNTREDGLGDSYPNQASVYNWTTEHNKTITLYAQWEFVGDINYNNLFSLSDWGTSYSGMINENDAQMTINFQQGNINIKDLTGKEVPDIYTSYAISAGHYHIPVKGNTKYIFKFNVSQNHSENDLGQFFLFYYTNSAPCSNPHQGWRPIKISGEYTGEFTTPADCVKIGMRFGIYSPYADITFSNIFICEKSRYDNLISKISNYKIRDYLPNFNSLPELPSVDIGYLFDGWRSEDNKLVSSLTNNQVKESQNSVIAYSFQRPITYTLHFNKNYENEKGSGLMADQIFTYDEVKKLTKNVFTRYRYKFMGWKANIKDEERFFSDEEEILNLFSNQDDSTTLYAQWEYIPVENTIKLDNNIFATDVLFDNIPVIEILIDKKVFFRKHI